MWDGWRISGSMKLFRNKSLVLLLLPGAVFLLLPIYGLVAGAVESFTDNGRFTWNYYTELAGSDRFRASLVFSLRTAFLSTLLAVVIGWWFTRTFAAALTKLPVRVTVWIPMLFPHFVWAYVVILFLAETGLAAYLLTGTGWLESPAFFSRFTNDQQGIGIILTYVWKGIPFVVLMLLPLYAAMKQELNDLVATLGGGRWQKFKMVEWPLILPTTLETFLILFAFTLTAYEVPALIGATYPEMISVLSYQWFYSSGWEERSLAFAAMFFISAVIIFISLAGYSLLKRRNKFIKREGQLK
jgi:putative spermidine/putrescine transport system permease protein